jgi:hypothetical protein
MRTLSRILLLAAGLYGAAALADDQQKACTALLCFANPGGPTQYDECKPSVNWVLGQLRRGRPFPRCETAEAQGVRVRRGRDRYHDCPAGWVELPAGFRPVNEERSPGRSPRRRWCARPELADICAAGPGEHDRGYERCETRNLRVPAVRREQCWIDVDIPGQDLSRYWYDAPRC